MDLGQDDLSKELEDYMYDICAYVERRGEIWLGDAQHFADACNVTRERRSGDIDYDTMIDSIVDSVITIITDYNKGNNQVQPYDWYDHHRDDDYLSVGKFVRDSVDYDSKHWT